MPKTDLSTQSILRTANAVVAPPATRPRLAGRLSDRAAFWLLASMVVFFVAGSSAPTPLYGTYAAEWHFSPITTTVIFGTYAVAVLAALLTVGRLSDHLGRRPVLLAAVVAQLAAMLVFAAASGVADLLLGRVLQGLAVGTAAGAVGAGLLDLDARRGAITNAVITPLGVGVGGIGAGAVVQFLPLPTRLVFLTLLVVFALQGVGVLFMREPVTRKSGAIASLAPEFTVAPRLRRPLMLVAPVLVAAWALPGFYGALSPALLRTLSGSSSILLGGSGLGAVAVSGAFATWVLRNVATNKVMLAGALGLAAGVGAGLVAVEAGSTVGFFVGSVIAGFGFGAGFQGAIRTVLPLAEAHERAGLLSVIYTIGYLAMGAPAVLAGYLTVHAGGLLVAEREYGVAVIVLALAALIGLAANARRQQSPVATAAFVELAPELAPESELAFDPELGLDSALEPAQRRCA